MAETNENSRSQIGGRERARLDRDAARYTPARRATLRPPARAMPVQAPLATLAQVPPQTVEQSKPSSVQETKPKLLPTTPVFASKPSLPKPVIAAPIKPPVVKHRYVDLHKVPVSVPPKPPVAKPAQAISAPAKLHKKHNKLSPASLRHAFVHRKPQAKLIPRANGRLLLKQRLMVLMIILVLAATSYVMYDTLRTNSQVRQQAAVQSVAPTTTDPKDLSADKAAEGKDETVVKPSAVDSYKVAADLPRVITISKIGVRARVMPMSVNSDGTMQAPKNIYDAGWYTSSAKPGVAGAMAIDGHSSGATHQGLFGNLDKLAAGDIITIERGDGTKLNYKVTASETVALENVDMAKFISPQGTKEGLNIMTCSGKWINNNTTMDHRTIVYAKRA